jgi:Flp pilus assembly protein TadB
MSISDVLALAAIVVSTVALWYAHRSAKAAEASAKTARQALASQVEEWTAARSDRMERRLSDLAKEAAQAWPRHGSLVPILDREPDLSPAEQEQLARRVYRALGRSEEDGVRAVIQWREVRSKG